MTLGLNLSPETAAKVHELAAAFGKDVETVVLEALEEKLGEANFQTSRPALTQQEWRRSP